MKYVSIEVDTNDADYNSKLSKIESEEDEIILREFARLINEFEPYETVSKSGTKWTHGHNFPDRCREDLGEKLPSELYYPFLDNNFDLLYWYLPYCEEGFHTITSIVIMEITSKEELLK